MAIPASPKECTIFFLSRLPEPEYQSLRQHLEWMPSPVRSSFYQRDQLIEQVYFPLSGEHSILAIMEDGDSVEVGMVGNEGFSTVEILTRSERA